MSAKKLDQSNFDDAISRGVALVDFYADWCASCRAISPIVDGISEERGDVTVGKINVSEQSALAKRYGVVSIPTLIVFKDGRENARLVGARPRSAILAALAQ